jgi:hypothetical protein
MQTTILNFNCPDLACFVQQYIDRKQRESSPIHIVSVVDLQAENALQLIKAATGQAQGRFHAIKVLGAHGRPNDPAFYMQRYGSVTSVLDAPQLAQTLHEAGTRPNFKGVTLYMCHSGTGPKCLASIFARHVPVTKAFEGLVYIGPRMDAGTPSLSRPSVHFILDSETRRKLQISTHKRIFRQADPTSSLPIRPHFATEAVRRIVVRHPEVFPYVSREFAGDRDMLLLAIRFDGLMLRYGTMTHRADREVVLTAIHQTGEALRYADPTLQDDVVIVRTAVRNRGLALQHASPRLQNLGEVVLAAVVESGFALQFASTERQRDREIALCAVRRQGAALQFVAAPLQNSFDIVLAAVRSNGLALRYASIALQNHPDIVTAAVHQAGAALQFASARLKADSRIVHQATQQNSAAIQFALLKPEETCGNPRNLLLQEEKKLLSPPARRPFHKPH